MKIKNLQLAPVNSILLNLSFPSDITIDSITGLVSLTSKVNILFDEFKKSTEILMNSYNIVPDENGLYDWSKSENSEEIGSKFNELGDTTRDIDLSFKEPNLFAKIGKGMHIQNVILLKEVLES